MMMKSIKLVEGWSVILMITVLIIGGSTHGIIAQFSYEFNALMDIELSASNAENNSTYNAKGDAQLEITEINLINKLKFGPQWAFNARFLLSRNMYDKLKKKSLPQLNVQWISKKRKVGATLGSFVNPFGLFNQSQLSTERTFVNLPLTHTYFTNISDMIGYVPNWGNDTEILINGKAVQASSNLNYGGYSTGLMMSWNIKPGKLNWKVALVNGASGMQEQLSDPLNFGAISRIQYRPTYFWEQGLSVSYGSFMVDSDISYLLPNSLDYRQSVIGTDFKFGQGHFEVSGEIMAIQHTVPMFIEESGVFDLNAKAVKVNNLAGYIDMKYEPPFLQGSYFAYRFDRISFGDDPSGNLEQWDDNVMRHSLALGYHINKYFLVRIDGSTQNIDTDIGGDGAYKSLRVSLTIHY
jgi:hypothetical protein